MSRCHIAGKRYQFNVTCPVPPDDIFAALTDFSEKRLEYFPSLSRLTYRVVERKGDSALVQEGTGPFVSKERYDWSTRGRIWSVVEESNVIMPGGMTDVRISPVEGRGCRIRVQMEREGSGWRGRLLLFSVIIHGGGNRFFRRSFKRTLRAIMNDRRKAFQRELIR